MVWYFDFISPFAYLQFKRLEALGRLPEMQLTPILFAGVLGHWGQLGPAEIAPKRTFTYQHVTWLARSTGVPFRMPEAHPFNPLKLLRLAIHFRVQTPVVARLFDFVWRDGFTPDNAPMWSSLLSSLGLDAQRNTWETAEVKATLRTNTEQAIAAGVFGVPSIAIGDRLFWGQDATDMALEYARDPASFADDDRLIRDLPAAVNRVGKSP